MRQHWARVGLCRSRPGARGPLHGEHRAELCQCGVRTPAPADCQARIGCQKSYARDRKLPWCESQPASLEPAAERARGSQLHHTGSRETKEQSKGRQMTQPTTFPTIRLYKYLRFPFGSVSFKPIIRKSLTTNIIGRENDVSAQTAKRNTGPGVMSVISGRPPSLGNTREWIWLLK